MDGGAFAAIAEGASVKAALQQLAQPLALRGWPSQTAGKAEGGRAGGSALCLPRRVLFRKLQGLHELQKKVDPKT